MDAVLNQERLPERPSRGGIGGVRRGLVLRGEAEGEALLRSLSAGAGRLNFALLRAEQASVP